MNRLFFIALILFLGLESSAQRQRPMKREQGGRSEGLREILKDLDLSRAQKLELQSFQKKFKASVDSVKALNQDSYAEQESLKTLRQQQMQAIQNILTDDQKEQLKKKLQDKKASGNLPLAPMPIKTDSTTTILVDSTKSVDSANTEINTKKKKKNKKQQKNATAIPQQAAMPKREPVLPSNN
jgi:hypothetical protein